MNPANLMRYATHTYNIKLKSMVGTIFRKHVERHEAGTAGKSMYQAWKVTKDLGDGLYECVRVDNTQDPMGAANPQKRTFKQKDILNYLKNK